MKILIIHQYFLGQNDPGGSRFNQFAKYWAARGHEVTVIAGTVHYATGQKDEQYRRKWVVEEEYAPNIRVLRCYVSEGYNKSFGGRVWGYLSFVLGTVGGSLSRGKTRFDLGNLASSHCRNSGHLDQPPEAHSLSL